MCGRFTLVTEPDRLMERFMLEQIGFELRPRYNIAPGQLIPAIIEDKGERRIGQLKWGLVPFWAKDEKIGYKMINAKSETVREKPAFKRLFSRKRCIIPADGFYEWKVTEDGKQPMRIMLTSGELFGLAALYDTWENPAGQQLHSCTVITTKPNDIVADIHDRMPVILRPEDESIWLDRENTDEELLQSLLVPYESSKMKAYPVPAIVGNVRNDVPECILEWSGA